MFIMLSKASSVVSVTEPYTPVPALLIKKSKLGDPSCSSKCWLTFSTKVSKVSTLLVSSGYAMAFCPKANTSATTLSASTVFV